jgi:hypothetical protein
MIYIQFTKITVEFYILIIDVYVLHCPLLLFDYSIIQDLNNYDTRSICWNLSICNVKYYKGLYYNNYIYIYI